MKKIIDSQGRLFGKVSAIDVLAVLLVVLMAAAILMKSRIREVVAGTTPMDTIRYELTLPNMAPGYLTSLVVGDLLYDRDNDSGRSIGEIVEIRSVSCRESVQLSTGEYVYTDVPNRYDIILTVQAQGTWDEATGHFYVNRTADTGLGMALNGYTKACLISGEVTAMGKDGV